MEEEKLTVLFGLFSQKTKSCGLYAGITGFGFTVMVYVPTWPVHAWLFKLIDGVMLTVAVIGVVPVLIAVKLGIVLVVPVVGVRPIVLLLTDQL